MGKKSMRRGWVAKRTGLGIGFGLLILLALFLGFGLMRTPVLVAHVRGTVDACHSFCANFCNRRSIHAQVNGCNDKCTSTCAKFSGFHKNTEVKQTPNHETSLSLAPITPAPSTLNGLSSPLPSATLMTEVTGTSSQSQPFAGAPLCPSHNDSSWHGLWDSSRGCHYNHTHNDNPQLGNSVFGAAGALWGGQTISYPWLTANENNAKGHPGYKYYVNLAPKPEGAIEGYEYIKPTPNLVTGFRVQYHDAGGNAHMVKRFHSYYLEAQIKGRNSNTIGTIKTGGHADFGCLHTTYKEQFLPLPGIDPLNGAGKSLCGGGQSIHSDPYRAPGKSLAEISGLANSPRDNMWIWTSHNQYGYNRLGFFFFRTLDSWGAIDPVNPYAEHFVCPDFNCKFNNSEHHVFNVYMIIPASLDYDQDGIVNFSGYTDVQGNIVSGCSGASATCVPLSIINAPVGVAIWSRNTSGIRPEGEQIRDHDIYFNGKTSGWLKFF